MERYGYLIIGGGMTADSAVAGIREIDKSGRIGLIGAEPVQPYDRPPLTKGLWKGTTRLRDIWRGTIEKGAELHLSKTAQRIDPDQKVVRDSDGETYRYDKLLLATGGTPRRLPNDVPEVVYYRRFADYKRLRTLARGNREIGVIGGGFIGAEISAALAIKKKKVTMIFPDEGIMGAALPTDLSRFLNSYYQDKGVTIVPGQKVSMISKPNDKKILVTTDRGTSLEFDALVAGIGIVPNTELAKDAGLRIENGVVVDRYLRTSNPDIYAAGDVADFENPHLGKRIRVEHEDNANIMGRFAGLNMAGNSKPYDYLPYFYSDLFDLGYEAVGELNSKLQTVADWKEEFREGVIYYLDQGRVRGVLLWNVWEQVDAARSIIAKVGSFTPRNVVGLLPKAE
jgi:NADPH-dependent 2,4-dienoyl-CoA reductase/sulfur reductase-like enzyme